MHFGWGTSALFHWHRAHRYSYWFRSQKFLGRCLGQLGLEGPAILSGLMLRRMSHLCTWQPLMDFGLTERSTSVRSHQLSSTGKTNASLSPQLRALKRKHWGFLFLFVSVLLTDMSKLKVTRNPLGCSAGLPVPPSQILPPMSWTTLCRGNCHSRLDSGCGDCLNTRGKMRFGIYPV